tara:strand:- start:1995 stop:2291 length:297 start_codon:yes stop_codon:yes gene_type:complete
MPTVGDFKFPYTKEGYEAAKRTSKMLGIPMTESNMGGNEDLYSSVGSNLDFAFGQGVDNRGGSRDMKTPGLSTPNFKTGATSKENMPWQSPTNKMIGY